MLRADSTLEPSPSTVAIFKPEIFVAVVLVQSLKIGIGPRDHASMSARSSLLRRTGYPSGPQSPLHPTVCSHSTTSLTSPPPAPWPLQETDVQ